RVPASQGAQGCGAGDGADRRDAEHLSRRSAGGGGDARLPRSLLATSTGLFQGRGRKEGERSMSSVNKEIVVEAPPERAFRVFTENFDNWWPRGHHIGKADMKAAIMEGRTNGRWYELGVDGTECDWGYVIAWEPPHRVVLAWQLDAQWQ